MAFQTCIECQHHVKLPFDREGFCQEFSKVEDFDRDCNRFIKKIPKAVKPQPIKKKKRK